jgi:tellurite resistance protein
MHTPSKILFFALLFIYFIILHVATLTPTPVTPNEKAALVTIANENAALQVSSANQEAAFASDETVSSEQERNEALQELRRLGVADEAPGIN